MLWTTKNLLIVFIVLFTIKSYAQKTIEQDSLRITFIKNDKLKNKYPKTYSGTMPNGFRVTIMEVDIKILDFKKGKFDPNKLYLVSEKPKFQYRPLDIFIAEGKKDYSRFELVTKKRPKATSKMQEAYDPNIKDTYLDYKIEGVSGIKTPINIGTGEFPDTHVFHFRPKVITDGKILIYFSISSDIIKKGTLYYGNEIIAKTDLE
ncbi:hypothetical protein [Maribacter aurantiacus]|uniref:Uncharacterized protein n=1 Tax=Maribacter aurantiacus TaxID=1882343 RepID=A0A5R8LR62_9FLAO|nr:hypothetical protein [Maribacter aurantiacus]TLF39754.1 hypothetical protein FEK29_17750 [Maribacter aurantiacus]